MSELQRIRHENLLALCAVLENDKVIGTAAQANVLGVAENVLRAWLHGQLISDGLARELEWAAQRPSGWIDEDHWGQPDA
ncbi:hypothetical protein [Luteibacter sp. 9133]|uniref:hypothetical protein n=1 Tax=Luteibacter sp. 9133 TaxID=1500891 RepID=UPI000A778F24|nr:hypothetical protein [Luteibacter sp. 9133]